MFNKPSIEFTSEPIWAWCCFERLMTDSISLTDIDLFRFLLVFGTTRELVCFISHFKFVSIELIMSLYYPFNVHRRIYSDDISFISDIMSFFSLVSLEVYWFYWSFQRNQVLVSLIFLYFFFSISLASAPFYCFSSFMFSFSSLLR